MTFLADVGHKVENSLQEGINRVWEQGDLSANSLLEEEALGVVDVLVVPILHPDPKRLRRSVKLVLRSRNKTKPHILIVESLAIKGIHCSIS